MCLLLLRLLEGKKQLVCLKNETLIISEVSYPEPDPIDEQNLRLSLIDSLTVTAEFSIPEEQEKLSVMAQKLGQETFAIRFPIGDGEYSYRLVSKAYSGYIESNYVADKANFDKVVSSSIETKMKEYRAAKTLSYAKSKFSSPALTKEVLLLDSVEELFEQMKTNGYGK
jgi:hypothetical protein